MPEDPINASSKAVPQINLRRRLVNAAVTFAAVGAVILVLTPLVAIFGYLVYRGVGSVNWAFLTQTPKPVGEAGGGSGDGEAGELAGDGHVELRELRLERAVEMRGVRLPVGKPRFAVDDEPGRAVEVGNQEGQLVVASAGRCRHQQREGKRPEDPAAYDAHSLSSEGRRLQPRSVTLPGAQVVQIAPGVRGLTPAGISR